MKKNILLIIGALLITLLAVFGVSYLMSLKKVSFTLDNAVDSAIIYTPEKREVKRISSNGSVLLTKGEYYAIPSGENISNKPINFTVKESDIAVDINPAYSDKYLQELLKKEQSAISKAIAAKYPTLIDSFTLTRGTLYKRGEWFGGLLEPKVSDRRDRRDPYRIVLQKTDSEWQVVRRPEYILTSSRYKEVPIDVLRSINSISQ